MTKRSFFILIILLTISFTEIVPQDNFRVMFYNVENLFDTNDNPEKDDDDFLPKGFMKWTPWKYWKKLRNITSVITAVGGIQSPALVGICEVENDSVIIDLIKQSPLRAQGYEYIITNSSDIRGINIALLYQKHLFKLLESNEYKIEFKNKKRNPTRNILHATGLLLNSDTLDVYVCHFPSRSGGIKETKEARIESSTVLRGKVDSLLIIRENANIIIMGDFNDTPENLSLSNTLSAFSIDKQLKGKTKIEPEKQLFNMFFSSDFKKEQGTYKYQGRWEIIDHLIVSGNMLNKENSIRVKNNEAYIFNESFLFEVDEKYYGDKPYRTNIGPRYNGGFSDHLPVYLDIIIDFPARK